MLMALTGVTCVVAALSAWRSGAEHTATVAEFLRGLVWAYVRAGAWAFIVVLVVYGVVNAAIGGALDPLGTLKVFALTAIFFVPVTGIVYVLRAVAKGRT
jgi:hypothetical protein